ncbi:MAG TPA: AMP-binding protein, partial [Kofleriaceae bacterium]
QPATGHEHVLLEGGRFRQSYQELRQEAARIANGLSAAGVTAGAPVVLQVADRPGLIATMWGCIAAGVTPVILACPRSYRDGDRIALQLVHALEQFASPTLVTRAATAPTLDALVRGALQRTVAIHALEELATHSPHTELHAARPRDLAMLLHTSGTTGIPTLVPITHRQILSGALAHAEASGLERGSPSLNWLALTHVSNLSRSIRDVYLAADQLHVATELVAQHPLRLLDLLADHRIHSLFTPAFGLRMLIAAAQGDTTRRDLSQLRSILSSGEPHAARPLVEVAALLARHGATDVVHVGYGLTESSSTITVGRLREASVRGLVDSGAPVRGASIRVVDGHGELVPVGELGHIELAGPMIVDYPATIDGWLRTGDLGFLTDGRLTVVDREKDIVIVNAVNYPTREIESFAESATELARAIACNVRLPDEDVERVLVFAVAPRAPADFVGIAHAVRTTLRRTLGLDAVVVVLPPGSLPEADKVSRSSLRSRYLAGELEVTT